MKTFWLVPVFFSGAAGCSTAPRPVPVLAVQDLSDQHIIRVTNNSQTGARISYTYSPEFGPLQMFMVRFRDRNGTIFPIVYDRADGWFTPKIHSATLRMPQRTLVVPAGSSVDFPRDIDFLAGFTQFDGARDRGPCQVQVKLSGYLDSDPQRPVETLSDWRPGPCPT
jgi:hypothetical protein